MRSVPPAGSRSRFQSTHPRGVRPGPMHRLPAWMIISIHAPAWGATMQSSGVHNTYAISIHAPAWGATDDLLDDKNWAGYFNPRTRVGCDEALKTVRICRLISIHAPAWGATCAHRFSLTHIFISIHAPAWGATKVFSTSYKTPKDFNPRTRVGCDYVVIRAAVQQYDFNPRTRVGCDPRV